MILNKRTKIEDPHESEMDFDLQHVDEETVEAIDSSMEEIQQRDNNTPVNIAGRILFNDTAETVNIRGKTLTKQEALFTDNSGSLRLVLWEQDTRKMKSGHCYNISNVTIKEFNGVNYLTLTKADKLQIDRQDDVPDKNYGCFARKPVRPTEIRPKLKMIRLMIPINETNNIRTRHMNVGY